MTISGPQFKIYYYVSVSSSSLSFSISLFLSSACLSLRRTKLSKSKSGDCAGSFCNTINSGQKVKNYEQKCYPATKGNLHCCLQPKHHFENIH